MIKKLSILEIFFLLLVLISFTWARYNPALSQPMALNVSFNNLLFSSGLTLAVILNVILLIKFLRTGNPRSTLSQIGPIFFYFLMILKDFWLFLKWNYIGEFFLATSMLLAPLVLEVVIVILSRKKEI